MKKLFSVLTLLLAINFIAVAGGAAWLAKTRHVDREKLMAIKAILFPPDAAAAATSQPVADATTKPSSMRLEELVAHQNGRTAGEQVEFIQHTFDAQMAQLDSREREVRDLEQQVNLANQKLAQDRTKLKQDRDALQQREQQTNKLASDQGFQDSLQRYIAMPAKQVKQIFMTLDDETVTNYLQAMEPRAAAKIIKEFKTDPELARIQKVLEKMRQSQAAAASVKE